MARYRDRYIGGLIVVTCGGIVHWPYGGGLTQARDLAPMSLLVWEAIRYGCEHGMTAFDFGRSQWDSGTFFFKRQWGAQPLPIFYEHGSLGAANYPIWIPQTVNFAWP